MSYRPDLPLIVQSDRSLLLEVGGPAYELARDAIGPFCELLKSPEHVHTYRITPLSVWNAAAAGMGADAMIEALGRYSRFEVPTNVRRDIQDLHGRYGRIRLEPREREEASFALVAAEEDLLTLVANCAAHEGPRRAPSPTGISPSRLATGARSSGRSSSSAGPSRTSGATSMAVR